MGCFSSTSWGVGGCGCTATMATTFLVNGCDALPYGALTVGVYTSAGGTLLASGTTSTSGSTVGKVTLTWSGAPGSYYLAVTGQSSRFAAYGRTRSLTGSPVTLTLTPAAGYVCPPAAAGCLLPVATVLHLTDSILGAVTLTGSGGAWAGTLTVSYSAAGCAGYACFAGTIPVTYTYDGYASLTVTYPTDGGVNECPGAGPSTYHFSPGATSFACSPFDYAGSIATTDPPSGAALYCRAGATVSYTITE